MRSNATTTTQPPHPTSHPTPRSHTSGQSPSCSSLPIRTALPHPPPPSQSLRREPTPFRPALLPRRRQRVDPSFPSRYATYVDSHSAYISPYAPDDLTAVTTRIQRLLTSPHPPTRQDQLGIAHLFEEVGRQAQEDLQTALHPENVVAQHITPISSLAEKYKNMLRMLDGRGNVERLTNQLGEDERARFEWTYEVVAAENRCWRLCGRIMLLASLGYTSK